MLLNNSIEFSHDLDHRGAELLPMKKWSNIRLTEIWVPNEYLPNRKFPFQRHLDKPIPHRILEKPLVPEDNFSIYRELNESASYSTFSSGEKLIDSLEVISSTNNLQKTETDLKRTSSYDICKDIIEPYEKPLNLSNSIPNLLEHLCFSDSDAENDSPETVNCDITDISVDSVENYLAVETDIASKNEKDLSFLCDTDPLIDNELISDNLITSAKSSSSLSSFEAELIKHEYFSSPAEKYSFINNESSSNTFSSKVERNLSLPIETEIQETSNMDADYQDNAICDSLRNCAINSSADYDGPDEILNKHLATEEHKLFEKLLKSSKDEIDNGPDKILDKYIITEEEELLKKLLRSSENAIESDAIDLGCENLVFNDVPEEIVNFPIAYQRPKERSSANISSGKRKSKKEKKSKKKTTKLPFDNFFQVEHNEPDEESNINDFYSNIMRKKYGDSYQTSEMPHVSASASSSFKNSKLQCGNEFKNEVKRSGMTMKSVADILNYSASSLIVVDNTEKDNKRCSQSTDQFVRIIVENIPLSVDEEMLKGIIQTYSDIKGLTLAKLQKSSIAELIMDIEDPDWLIDTLNGSHPFGDFTGEGLKCHIKK